MPIRRMPSSTRVTAEVEVAAASVLIGNTTGSDELHAASVASSMAATVMLHATTPTDGLAARRLLIDQSVRGAAFLQADPLRTTPIHARMTR